MENGDDRGGDIGTAGERADHPAAPAPSPLWHAWTDVLEGPKRRQHPDEDRGNGARMSAVTMVRDLSDS
jgi:hypothetical protein